MTPYLQQVARKFYSHYGDKISELVFVFPNRRSGIFFQKYLAIEARKPLFTPKILTINELFGELSDLEIADRMTLLFNLYEIFLNVSNSNESFDDFVYWGEMLLNDFDDVDKYVVDAHKLFMNVTDLKTIESEFAYLEPEQIDIIRRFWTNFIPAYGSDKKQNFAKTWEVLYDMYTALRNKLRQEGLAYEGMIFRDVAEGLRSGEHPELPYKKVVFVGLNAMTTAERDLLSELNTLGIADFYWDYAAPTLSDPENKASYFAKQNQNQFPSSQPLEEEEMPIPEIEVIGIPSAVGQTKYTYDILENLMKEGAIPYPEHAMNTAVVLPDENLLLPTLYAIPNEINPINVTMGYSLKSTPIAGLMEHLFELQKTIKWENGEACFYFRCVEPLLNHRYVTSFDEESSAKLLHDIKQNNKVYIPAGELALNPLLRKMFSPVRNVEQAPAYLTGLLEYLQGGLDSGEVSADSDVVPLTELEKEFIYHYYITVNRMGDVMNKFSITFSIHTYFRLLRKMAEGITIPFRGEPLSGLQIMGVLETRGLDFENLIILSMNEGVFPLKKAANSFIPFNLRKGFGLSTTEHQDSIYAYHFYRMISRAKKVFLLYDTRDSGMQTGEVSRFVYQMKYHYGYPIREKALTYDISVTTPEVIEIKKTPEVQQRMAAFLEGGRRRLSASAVNTYLNCPMQFYLQYVERLREEEDVTETMETNTFGTIFHAVMEAIYERCKGELVTSDYLEKVIHDTKYLRTVIRRSFAMHFMNRKDVPELVGFNYLIGEVLRKYVIRVLEEDKKRTPFLYIDSELVINTDIPISNGHRVSLTGSIDRLDEKEGIVRVIDYKTGSGKLEFSSMKQLFDCEVKDRPKAVMQVQMYSMLYNEQQRPAKIEPNIFYLRSFFNNGNDTGIVFKPGKEDQSGIEPGRVADFIEIEKAFRKEFVSCLDEIFDAEMPFKQTSNEKNCEYCPFTTICKR
ncbi:MAG: PD-(D/E)XK nuclease family protein [Bacteroidales bacterium]